MGIEKDKRQKQLEKWGKKLPEDWRQNQLGANTPDLYKSIIKSAMNIVQLAMAKELDEDLASLKEQVKDASAQYSDGTKQNHLQIEFLVDVLRGRGEDVPDPADFVRKAANGEVTAS
jgi:hypothetical protein